MSLPKSVKPEPFRDIIALISFNDVPPIPAVGYLVTASATDKVVFMTRLERQYVDWGRIVAWRYMDDAWPGYTTEGIDYA